MAHDLEAHGCAGFAPYHRGYRVVGQLAAGDGRAVHGDDPVARHHSRLFCRAVRQCLYDHEGVPQDVECDAYAAEVARHPLIELLDLLGIHVCRVRVKLRQHGLDRRLHERVGRHVIDIEVCHGVGGHLQLAHLHVVLRVEQQRGECCQDCCYKKSHRRSQMSRSIPSGTKGVMSLP